VKLHKDWIQELYYKELAGLTSKEKTHDIDSPNAKKVKSNSKRNRGVSEQLQSR
tara:strand:- start:159 stop:320 length:162 start_codon:yes stop_codon:yes gene_type:complete